MEVITNADYTTRTTCRLCNGGLKDVLSLGPIHISTFSNTKDTSTAKVPIDLVECINCGLFQLRHTVSGEAMYSAYWYQSGLNKSMVAALKNIVDETLARTTIHTGDIIVDIGANDGTLLLQYSDYVRRQCWLVGYEPSDLASLAHGIGHVIINDYFNAPAYNKMFTQKAKIITSIAMFYDLENPHAFVSEVASILDRDGVWTIQLMDLLSMVRMNDFPNLCHEHLEYYKLSDIALLLAQHGLQIFDVEYNAVNGSSLRVYVSHKDVRPIEQSYFAALTAEFDFFRELGDVGAYFKLAVENVYSGILSYITYLNGIDKKVALLAASTKANVALEYFKLGPDLIDHAAEVNPDKFGKFTTTGIPIIPESESLAKKPDAYILMAWGFLPFFIDKFANYLKSGGKFIVPLPDPRVIEMQDGVIQVWPI